MYIYIYIYREREREREREGGTFHGMLEGLLIGSQVIEREKVVSF